MLDLSFQIKEKIINLSSNLENAIYVKTSIIKMNAVLVQEEEKRTQIYKEIK